MRGAYNGLGYPRLVSSKPTSKSLTIHEQIGAFLRKRRERADPADFGVQAGARRRTPGLRREEVAERAGISVDWYMRLEQGRESLPSKATVESLAKALRLTQTEHAHLLRLANGSSGRPFERETVPPLLEKLVCGISSPADIVGARSDLLCWNAASVELFRDFGQIPIEERNTLYQLFTSAQVRSRYPDWEEEARSALESFRITYDFWSHAPEFNALVDQLCEASVEFGRWWNAHEVRPKYLGRKVMIHPKLGPISVAYSTFQSSDNPDLRLVLYGDVASAAA
ncbi:MAG TPA: helix-turn-helix transcriptional regulator [Polyangia bacterium]